MSGPLQSTTWADTSVAPRVKELISQFFRLADLKDENAGEEMAEKVFSADADLIVGTGTFHGSTEISKCRANVWKTIDFRKHTIDRVFVNSKANDVIVVGTLEARTADGSSTTFTDFAGRFVVAGDVDEKVKMKSYQAWTGTSRNA